MTAKDDLLTVSGIGALAYLSTDLAHEVIGHGIGLLLAGGRSGILTTTRLIYAAQLPDTMWRIFDLGGPVGNLLWAGLALLLQHSLRGTAPRLRLYLWTTAAFSLFWEFGYLMKCGVTGSGDGMALIVGLPAQLFWRALLFLVGVFLYRRTVRLLATDLHFIVSAQNPDWRARVRRLLWILYLTGGIVACAGAIFDPRGTMEILNSGAATSFLASLGLAFVPRLFPRLPERNLPLPNKIPRSLPLILGALVAVILFVMLLGPGVHVTI